jgi:hypothetical protein
MQAGFEHYKIYFGIFFTSSLIFTSSYICIIENDTYPYQPPQDVELQNNNAA